MVICMIIFMLQLRVVASDGGNPPKSASAVVEIEVLYNFNEPQFLATTYNATVLETIPLGTSILQVQAQDADITVSLWM